MAIHDRDGGTERVDVDGQRVEDRWASFQQARQGLAEVMTDEDLAGLGFDLDVLDEAP